VPRSILPDTLYRKGIPSARSAANVYNSAENESGGFMFGPTTKAIKMHGEKAGRKKKEE
jgi:hypothetical protein